MCRDWLAYLAPAVAERWQIDLGRFDVSLRNIPSVCATLHLRGDRHQIRISRRLVELLATINKNWLAYSLHCARDADLSLDQSQVLLDAILDAVFAIDPGINLIPESRRILEQPGLDAHRADYVAVAAAAVERRGRVLGLDFLAAGVTAEVYYRWVERTTRTFGAADYLFDLLQMEIKFILLHEIAHLAVEQGALDEGEDPELAADRLAAEMLFHVHPGQDGDAIVRTNAVGVMFVLLAVGLVEDFMGLFDRSRRIIMPEPMRIAYEPMTSDHPPVRKRAHHLGHAFPGHMFGAAVGLLPVIEAGVKQLKHQVVSGVLDIARFKRFARIRTEEMQNAYFQRTLPQAQREAIAGTLLINRDWDHIDVRWGQIPKEALPDDWTAPILSFGYR